MSDYDLKDIWAEAQAVEERLQHKGLPHESREWWEQNLVRDFSLDFSFFSGKAVLEVGCGGHGMIHYIDNALAKVGIDPLCTGYRDYFANWNTNVHHVTGIGESLPLRSDTFDIVICYNVIDHGISPATILKEVGRVLRKDGRFVFSVATFFHLPKALRSKLYKFDRPHPHHLSRKETRQFLQDAAFRIDFYNYQWGSIGDIILDLKGRRLYHAAQRLFATMLGRGTSFFICSKVGASEADTKL